MSVRVAVPKRSTPQSFRSSLADLYSRVDRGLLVIVVFGAALRFSTLSTQSFDLDESVTVAMMHHTFLGMLRSIPRTESTPPLYYVLIWVWTRVFGVSEVGLRSFSALAGTAIIPLAYATARRLASRRAGLIAAGLTAFSPWLVWYSQEARSYALFGLLGLASFAAFIAAVQSPSRRRLAVWACVSALALLTHYFAVFLCAPEALYLMLPRSRRRDAVLAVSFLALVGAALVPLVIAQSHELELKAEILQTPLSSRLLDIPTSFLLGEAVSASVKIALAAAAAAFVAFGLYPLLRALAVSRSRPPRSEARPEVEERRMARAAVSPALWIGLAVALVALLLPVVLALLGRDYLDARNVIVVWAPLVVVLSVGYAAAGRAGVIVALALGTLSFACTIAVDTDVNLQRTDYRRVAAMLSASPRPGQRALVITPNYDWTPFGYYLRGYPPLSRGRVGISEVDLIGWDDQALSHNALAVLRRRGFRITGEWTVQRLRLVRLNAPSKRGLSRRELTESALAHETSTVMIEARQKTSGAVLSSSSGPS